MLKSFFVISAATLAASDVSSSAFAASVVAPNAYENTVGGGGITPGPLPSTKGTVGGRFQQVYNAGEFGAFGASESISTAAFRARTSQFAFAIAPNVTVSNVIVTLSTTARSADTNSANYISGQFADNIGADVKTVYSGPLTFTSTAAPGSTAIDYVLNLSTPFTYAKGAGNLLIDFTVPDGSTLSTTGSIGYAPFDYASDDFVNPDGVATAFGASSAATIGANSTAGVVTKFTTVVPEPASLGALSLASLVLVRRRK
jgi:hypothetical protein